MVSETLHRHRKNKGAYSTYYKNFLAVFIGYTPGARYFGHIPPSKFIFTRDFKPPPSPIRVGYHFGVFERFAMTGKLSWDITRSWHKGMVASLFSQKNLHLHVFYPSRHRVGYISNHTRDSFVLRKKYWCKIVIQNSSRPLLLLLWRWVELKRFTHYAETILPNVATTQQNLLFLQMESWKT